MREVPLRELNRETSTVIGAVREGERLIITRHGNPVAVILSIADAIELAGLVKPAASKAMVREALRAVVGEELERRLWRRELGRLMHGRWFEAGGSGA